MQCRVNGFGQLPTDAPHFGDFFRAGLTDFLQATEIVYQVFASFGPHARNPFQGGLTALLVPALPVSGNRKAVRLIPYMLDQVQCR